MAKPFRRWELGEPSWDAPLPDWRVVRLDEHKLVFGSAEELEQTKAMIEFCTNYEPELFQTFYKWFRKERKVD